MSRIVQAEVRFRELLLAGFLPGSECGRAFLDLAEPLLESGVLSWERSGTGRRLAVLDRSVLADFVAKYYPRSVSSPDELRRIESVARFRDSKVLANNAPEIVLYRAWSDDALIVRGKSAQPAQATTEHSLFAFTLSDQYALHGSCALVENPALFFGLERLKLNLSAAILSRGCISARLLQWLKRQNTAEFLHLPDYDPVGLSEFLRIYAALGERVRLHLPADLEERFRRFSNPALLRPLKSSGILRRVRACRHPAVQKVLRFVDGFSGGLEQEALLVNEL